MKRKEALLDKTAGKATRLAKRGALTRLLASIKNLVDPALPVEDRRNFERVRCQLEVSYLTEHGLSNHGILLDLSRRGLQIKTDQSLNRGLTIVVKPPSDLAHLDFAPVMAQVMWSKHDNGSYLAGLLLPPGLADEETWLEALMSNLGHGQTFSQRRQFVRADAHLPGQLVIDEHPPQHVTILNLSLGGALLTGAESFPKGTPFKLRLGPFRDLPLLDLCGIILRENSSKTPHSAPSTSLRFGPLEGRRHALLKEYILRLLKS